MPLRPSIALAASFTYFTILATAIELFRRRFRLAPDLSRKSLHVGIGLWSIPTIYAFSDARWAVLPYLLWGAFAYVSYRFDLLRALEDEGPSLGSVFFPLSVALLLGFFWGQLVHVAIAGIMAMTLGDTTAALVGQRAGTRKYRVLGHARSMEGTLALFLVASTSIACTLIFVAGPGPTPSGCLFPDLGNGGGLSRDRLSLRKRQSHRADRDRGDALRPHQYERP